MWHAHDKRNVYTVLVINLNETDHLEDLAIE